MHNIELQSRRFKGHTVCRHFLGGAGGKGVGLFEFDFELCIGQIEASTSPPGIPRAFDTFAVPGRREFDYQSLSPGGEFDPHALGVGNLNCTLNFM